MLTSALTTCFVACYAIALGLEVASLRRRPAWFPTPLIVATVAGLIVHALYLFHSAIGRNALPISTADWLLWAAWLLAVVYFATLFYLPRSPTGLVLLPIVLALVCGSHWASAEPLATGSSFKVLGMVHGVLLLIATVAVCIGFLAGLMYLVQSYALKHARSAANRLRLPSLEWLERANSRSLGLSAVLIALGFASGLAMSLVIHRGDSSYALWTDPVVLSLAAMLLWLIAAEIFRIVYPAARRGRKVAYLTLASFVFLVIVLASFTLLDNVHGPNRNDKATRPASSVFNPQPETHNPKSFGSARVHLLA